VGTKSSGELVPLLRQVQPKFGNPDQYWARTPEFFGDLAGVAQEEAVWQSSCLIRKTVHQRGRIMASAIVKRAKPVQ